MITPAPAPATAPATPQEVSAVVGSTVKSLLSAPKVPDAPAVPAVPATPVAPTTPVTPVAPVAPVAGMPTPTPATPLTSAGIPDALITKPGATETPPVTPVEPVTPPVTPPAGTKEENMSAMRQRITDQQKIIDADKELKAKYLDADGNFMPPTELTDKYKEQTDEIARLGDELAKVNFAKSPEFQTRYQAPVDATFQQITELVTELGGKEGLAEQLAGATVKERLDYLKTNLPDATGILLPMYSSLDKVLAMRHQALETHKESSAQLTQQETVQKQQQLTVLRNSMRDQALSTMEREGYFMFSKVPGNDEWNARVDEMKGAVEVLVNSEDVAMQTEALAKSVAAPVYRALYEEERTARTALEQQLSRYQTATPGTLISHSAPTTPSVGSVTVPAGMTAQGAAQAVLGKIGLA